MLRDQCHIFTNRFFSGMPNNRSAPDSGDQVQIHVVTMAIGLCSSRASNTVYALDLFEQAALAMAIAAS
jgi:hypothetical protein